MMMIVAVVATERSSWWLFVDSIFDTLACTRESLPPITTTTRCAPAIHCVIIIFAIDGWLLPLPTVVPKSDAAQYVLAQNSEMATAFQAYLRTTYVTKHDLKRKGTIKFRKSIMKSQNSESILSVSITRLVSLLLFGEYGYSKAQKFSPCRWWLL